jgi:hypothetical protein
LEVVERVCCRTDSGLCQFLVNPRNASLRICTVKTSSSDPKSLSEGFGVAWNLRRNVVDRGYWVSFGAWVKVHVKSLALKFARLGLAFSHLQPFFESSSFTLKPTSTRTIAVIKDHLSPAKL